MNPNVRTGKIESDGNAADVVLGFVPDYVKIVNVTDGDIMHEWFKGMDDGHAIQTTNHDTAQLSRITSNGISALDGSDGAGFTIGTAVAEDEKDLYYVAVRNGAAG